MRNRRMILAGLMFLLLFPLTAENLQKQFSVHSQEYEALTMLYIEQGMSLPSSSGPWSAAELSRMLSKVQKQTLSEAGRQTYSFIDSSLREVENHRLDESLAMSYNSTLALEGYLHTNTTAYTDESLWRYDYEKRAPLYTGSFETWTSGLFYGDIELVVRQNPTRGTNDSSDLFGSSAFTTNIVAIPPSTLNDLNMNFPYRAFVAAGGDSWNLQFGRDNLSWGSGHTGNLMLGDHLLYQDLLKFTTFHDTYKFTSVYSFFPHPANYYPLDSSPDGQQIPLEGIRMFAAHRLEFRLFDDLLNLAISESMMYMSEDGVWNLGLLNPLMIYHDNYIRANSNSMLALDVEAAPMKNLSVYGQIAVDEFPLPGEPASGGGTNPTAFGYLAGVKGNLPVGKGYAYGILEGAYTDPFLYLRGDGDGTPSQGVDEYGINYVVGIRSFSPDGNISISQDFLGYEYGCDAIVANLTAGYRVFDSFYLEGTLFYMLHGVNDMYTLWKTGSDTPPDPSTATTPTDSEYTGNALEEIRDAVETTLLIELKGGYKLLPQLELYGQLDWVSKANFQNLAANGTEQDLQLSIGAAYSF